MSKFISITLLVFLAVSCGKSKHASMPPAEIKVATAVNQSVPNVVEFITQTKSTRSYIIQPRVNGFLKSVDYNSGMPVKRGQRLFTIDAAPFQTQLVESRAALSSAHANLVEAEAAYRRSVPLVKINAISQSEFDSATATLAAARESVESAKAVVDNALLNISYCTISAPGGGLIAPSVANVGDYVGVGTAYQTLTTISFNDSISVNLSLPTVEYYKIVSHSHPTYIGDNLLQDITLTLSDGSVYPERGVYQYTQPSVDSNSGSIVFNVRFPNKEGVLKGGQFARVKANIGEAQQRVLIPARSVNEMQGVYSTYVVNSGDSLDYRKLTVGDVVGSDWVILSGVESGERVITEGFLKAKSGMKIKPIEVK